MTASTDDRTSSQARQANPISVTLFMFGFISLFALYRFVALMVEQERSSVALTPSLKGPR